MVILYRTPLDVGLIRCYTVLGGVHVSNMALTTEYVYLIQQHLSIPEGQRTFMK